MDEIENINSVQPEPQPAPAQQPAPMTAPAPMPPPAPVAPPTPMPAPVPPAQNQPIDLSGNKGMAILAYLGPLILVPFLTDAKNDPFVKFHLKQGLVLIIVAIGWSILRSFIPGFFLTFGMFYLINLLFSLISYGFLAIAIVGIVNAVNGQMKELPIIGGFAKSFNF